ncbi:MAG: hypothetical protein WAV98_04160 [Minisyncoccia bacterium]
MENNSNTKVWMAPVDEVSKKSKLVIILATVVVFFVVTISFYRYYYGTNNTEPKEASGGSEATLAKTPEQIAAEKLIKSQSEELDKLRAAYQAQKTSQPTTTVQAQIKTLDTLRTEAVKQQTPATIVAPKTVEEQVQELDALRSAAKK